MDKANRTIIKAFEQYVKDFKPCCTSDEVDLDMLKAVLGILNDEKNPNDVISDLKQAVYDFADNHHGIMPEYMFVSKAMSDRIDKQIAMYPFDAKRFHANPLLYGAHVITIEDNTVLLCTGIVRADWIEGGESE